MAYIYDLSDTWNAAGTTFFGIKMNVTNSASASGSKLLSLQVAGTEYFGVDKDGNVTIGNGGDLNISSATGGDASKIYNDAEDLYFQTNGSTRLLINSSGNIGVGNTSPGAKLDVTGNIRLSASSPNIELNNGGPMVYSTTANTLMFATGGGPSSPVERMRIDSSGNVGIGTSSPVSKFHVNSSTSVATYMTAGNPAGGTLMGVNASGASIVATYASNNLIFGNYASGGTFVEFARINSSGNFGVGTSSPKTRLQASAATTKNAPTLGSATDAPFYLSNSDTAYGLVIGNSSADGRVWFQAQRTDSSATAYNITLNEAGGQVLVGTASAFDNVSYLKFQSLGGVSTKIGGTSLTSQMSFFNDNGRVGWIGTDGTTTSYNTSSDARLKENIANADDASSLIDAIQVRKFDWKADGSHQRYGFIAQELIEVAPEAVSAPPEEDQMMAVDYSKLVPMLVKELQSLRARVAQLEGN